MKYNHAFLCTLLILMTTTTLAESIDPNTALLPSPFPVYTNNKIVINHPQEGFTKKLLPTNNDYTGHPGCYIACYSHQQKNSIYPVGKDIYVMGQVRLPGNYFNRVCVVNPTQEKLMSPTESCNQKISSCHNHCWSGGDSGGWFGIQK